MLTHLKRFKKLTMILSVVISSGKAVVSTFVWFWLVDESEWTLNRSANDCNFVGHPSSSSPSKQSDCPSHNQPAGIQPLLPLQWYSFSPQKSKHAFLWLFSEMTFQNSSRWKSVRQLKTLGLGKIFRRFSNGLIFFKNDTRNDYWKISQKLSGIDPKKSTHFYEKSRLENFSKNQESLGNSRSWKWNPKWFPIFFLNDLSF